MSIHMDIHLDKSEFIVSWIEEAVRAAMIEASMRIQGELAKITPKDTGALRRSFRAKVLPTGIRLSWGTDYADVVDAGAPPHLILPVNKEALKWPTGGGFAYSKGHMHPGQRPQNYSTLTGIEALRIMKEELFKALFTTRTMVS